MVWFLGVFSVFLIACIKLFLIIVIFYFLSRFLIRLFNSLEEASLAPWLPSTLVFISITTVFISEGSWDWFWVFAIFCMFLSIKKTLNTGWKNTKKHLKPDTETSVNFQNLHWFRCQNPLVLRTIDYLYMGIVVINFYNRKWIFFVLYLSWLIFLIPLI